MTGELETLLHTEDQISEYFILETLLVSTRTADLYKARDKSRATHISLWVAKQPLPINSPAVRHFLARLGELQRIFTKEGSILSYGVDAAGVAFCIFQNLDGYVVTHGNVEKAEAERRFMACLRLIERLHDKDLMCGDLCANSFWVDRAGNVRFIGVMGLLEKDLIGESQAPASEIVPYIAPEQQSHSGNGLTPMENIGKTVDVYALGVLGYRLFSGKFPFDPGSNVMRPLNELMSIPPVWGNQVFSTCLNAGPQERYSTAGAILAAIQQIRANVHSAESTPARINKSSNVVKTTESLAVRMERTAQSKAAQVPEEEETKGRGGNSRIIILASLTVVLVFVGSLYFFKNIFKPKKEEDSPLATALGMHSDALKNQDFKLKNPGAGSSSDVEKEELFRKCVQSDDPVCHNMLIIMAKEAKTDNDRQRAETAILDRARRLGLRRSAEIVRPWLRSLKTGELPDTYEAMLRTLDTNLPPEAVNSAIRQAYAAYSRIVIKLTASLALDTGKLDQFQPVLAQLIGDSMKNEEVKGKSMLSLILFSTELVSTMADDAIKQRDKIPDQDIVWLLNVLAQRNDINVRAIASLAVDRKLLPPIRQFFISSIRDREDLPIDILNGLVKASAGAITADEVTGFGNWFDRLSDKVLLAVCADAPDTEAKLTAFDILAGKSLSIEPAGSLIKWVKDKVWDKRSTFIEPIGILSNIELYPIEKVLASMEVFDPYLNDQSVTDAFLGTGEPKIVKPVIKRYSGKIGLGRRLTLLTNPDKEVRILAIGTLKDENNIAVIKIIIDHYENEKDQDVKKAYLENPWVKERAEKGGF